MLVKAVNSSIQTFSHQTSKNPADFGTSNEQTNLVQFSSNFRVGNDPESKKVLELKPGCKSLWSLMHPKRKDTGGMEPGVWLVWWPEANRGCNSWESVPYFEPTFTVLLLYLLLHWSIVNWVNHFPDASPKKLIWSNENKCQRLDRFREKSFLSLVPDCTWFLDNDSLVYVTGPFLIIISSFGQHRKAV